MVRVLLHVSLIWQGSRKIKKKLLSKKKENSMLFETLLFSCFFCMSHSNTECYGFPSVAEKKKKFLMLFFISLPKVLKYAGIRGQNVVKKKKIKIIQIIQFICLGNKA